MKNYKCYLIITMLLGIGYSQCNSTNWLDYYPDMEGCHLAFANMGGTNLTNANLTGADLRYVSFPNSILTNANLSDSDCKGAYFAGANLDGTNFDGANLTYTYFDENEDGYDDVSYEVGAESGDLNLDGINNILDIVTLVNIILQEEE